MLVMNMDQFFLPPLQLTGADQLDQVCRML
jgi:hypothetical protein